MIKIESIQKILSKQIVNSRFFYPLLTILLIVGFLPYVYLFQFSFPLMDDFIYNARINNYSFWETQQIWYLKWTGRYTSTMILSLFSYSFEYYAIVLLMILVSLILAATLSIKELFHISTSKSFLYGCAFILFIVNTLPNIPEGLYWLASSAMYIFPLVFIPIFIKFIQPYLRAEITSYTHFSVTIIFLFLLIGFNEPMAFVVSIHLIFVLVAHFFSTKKINYPILIILGVSILGILIIGFAPGNSVRTTDITNQLNFKIVLYSIFHTIVQFNQWLFFTPTIPLLIILFFSFKKLSVKTFSQYQIPVFWNILQLFLSLLSCNILVFYSINSPPPGRMLNIMYIYFLVMILFISQKIVVKYGLEPKKQYKMLGLLFVFLVFVGSINYQDAIQDIIGNDAYTYHKQQQKRHVYLKNITLTKCEVSPLETMPKSLFISDITEDSNNWHNKIISNYYGIDTLVLKKTDKAYMYESTLEE